MKNFVRDFLRRGLTACGFGPIILAVLYIILESQLGIQNLTVTQVSAGIFSLSALAFMAGGMNAIYKVEHLPLMLAILIHGAVLYVGYLCTYLLNGWLELSSLPILIFSCIFVVGYLVIWVVIYWIIKRNTRKVNEILKRKQQTEAN